MQLISKHSVLSAKLEFRLRCFGFGSFSEKFFPDTDDEDVEAMITLHVFKSFAASHSTTRSSIRSGVVSKSAPKNPFHEARNERKIASSESRRIAWLAFDHNVQMVSHGWNTAIGLAADLQLAAAMPVARYVEYLTPCAYLEELTVEPFVIDDDGCLEIPDRPGLGVELDRDRLKQFIR